MGIVNSNGYESRDKGMVYFPDKPLPMRVLNALLADLPDTAAEAMLGELPCGVKPRNAKHTAGPAESQVYFEDRNDY
jgi:hypothetical protein